MSAILWLLLLAGSAPLWYSIGVRVERGRREKAQAEYETKQMARGNRSGSIVLNSVKIRR